MQHVVYVIGLDILMHNFTGRWPPVNDSIAVTALEAIFKMKTYTACNTQYNHHNKKHPADRCAKMFTEGYTRKSKKLEQVFTTDMVGNETQHILGPFERLQHMFYRGQITPLRARGFREINRDFRKSSKYWHRRGYQVM